MKRKKRSTYLGGEWDREKMVIPRDFGLFLRKKYLFLTLLILFICAVVMVWMP